MVFVDDVPILFIGGMVVDGVFLLVHYTLYFVGTVIVAASRWRRGVCTMAVFDSLALRLPAAWHPDCDGAIALAF